MGVSRSSGKNGSSSGDWKRRILESSFSRSRSTQSRKLSLLSGISRAPGL